MNYESLQSICCFERYAPQGKTLTEPKPKANKVCMFVNNPIRNDPRVKGEARILAKHGWDVTVVGTLAEGVPKEEIWEGVRFLRFPRTWPLALWLRSALFSLFNLPAIYNKAATTTSPAEQPTEKVARGPLAKIKNALFSSLLPATWNWLLHLYYTQSLLPKLLKNDYNVYHAHDLDTLFLATEASRLGHAKLVYDSHELWVNWQEALKLNPQLLIDDWRQVEKDSITKADLVITVSEGIANRLQESHGLKSTPLVLYNCTDLREPLTENYLHQLHSPLSDGRPIVLYQGVIQPKRGLGQYAAVARLLPDAHFVIIGPSGHARTFHEMKLVAAELENLHLLKPVPYDDLWKVTHSADIGYVCTEPYCDSYNLGVGNKIFEYIEAGLCVCASDVAGHRELQGKFDRSRSPISLIPHDNAERAAAVIKDVFQNAKTLSQSRQYARELAASTFNWGIVSEKLVSAYSRLAS